MGFAEERHLAERALAAGDQDDSTEPEFPPVAQRFADARQAAGLTQTEVAERWHQPPSMYWDLEFHDSEAFDVVSVRDLICLGDILQVSVFYLLFGEEPSFSLPTVSYSEIVRRLREKMAASDLSVEQMSEVVGVELGDYLQDPEQLAHLPISLLRWICRAVGVDWVETLTNPGKP
jgi:transcriptional regulator with XRE-family HTH domain